ncbi:MAG: hypothetical protein LC114_12665 [Bryobacterales bacterium]|nr:hypothetical protein [Bryobacterales bacterium]
MPRFIDHLLAEKTWHVNSMGLPGWMFAGGEEIVKRVAKTRHVLNESNVVLIDNVAEYYFSHHVDANRGPDGPEQFPQLAPPFPMTFYEYTLVPWMYDRLFIEAANGKPRALNQVGVLVIALEIGDIHVNASQDGPLLSVLNEHKNGLPPKWCVCIELFAGNRADRLAWCPALRLGLTVDAHGALASDPRCNIWAIDDRITDDPAIEQSRLWALMALAYPALLATSFLHCRNVSTEEHVPPAKLNKAYRRRHGLPLVRYKTLTIEPMKRILRKEGQVDVNGLPKALHICRGHFKDYRASAGLFGKHKGLFW